MVRTQPHKNDSFYDIYVFVTTLVRNGKAIMFAVIVFYMFLML